MQRVPDAKLRERNGERLQRILGQFAPLDGGVGFHAAVRHGIGRQVQRTDRQVAAQLKVAGNAIRSRHSQFKPYRKKSANGFSWYTP